MKIAMIVTVMTNTLFLVLYSCHVQGSENMRSSNHYCIFQNKQLPKKTIRNLAKDIAFLDVNKY
ncbi:MAG: hypothetical protein EAX87_13530 [Candidatus Thorarchaeota archaeon]|nr:hypothetical protein [Candidatus Thorarchaeota archaeon]